MLPTFLTVVMYPVLIGMYYRLTKKEEKKLEERFGEEYRKYKEKAAMFIPC